MKKERKKENDPKTNTHIHTKKENKQTKERKTNTLMWCWWASSVNEAPVISLRVA
jgi:hypothetical protein